MELEKTLLIVDDDPALCRAVQRIFKGSGWKSIVATSVSHALELMPQADAVLSDWRMPDGGGPDILRAARAHDRPVVVFTSEESGVGHPHVVLKHQKDAHLALVEKVNEVSLLHERSSRR